MVRFKSRVVTEGNIVDNSVTTAKILDGTITNAKMDVDEGHNIEVKYKTADESVNNSTTLQNDDHLVTSSLPANSIWLVELSVYHLANTDATGDFKFAFVGSATANMGIGGLIMDAADALANVLYTAGAGGIAFGAAAAGSFRRLFLTGAVVVGATAGTLQFQWAQNGLVAQNYTVGTNYSYMIVRRVS